MEDYKAVLELLCGKMEKEEDYNVTLFATTRQGGSSKNDQRRRIARDLLSLDDPDDNCDKVEDDNDDEGWNPNFYIYRGGKEASAVVSLPTTMIHVLVEVSVREIPEHAFFSQDSLCSIVFPRDLHQIGDRAFAQCKSLTTISIPPLVETIGRSAFSDCTSLARVEFGRPSLDENHQNSSSNFMSLQDGCFAGCQSLEDIIQLPSSVSNIGKRAFYNCSKLPKMDLSTCNGLTRIENQSFGCCRALTICRLPRTVTTIGTSAFGQCYELRHIRIGESRQGEDSPSSSQLLSMIGDEAFASCRSLRAISLPSSLERIGKRAFANCFGLMSIEFAPTIDLREVGEQAFLHCKRLVNIALPEPIAHSKRLKHGVFEGCTDLQERFAPILQVVVVNNDTFLKEALCIRYDASPLHQLCYHQTHLTMEESMKQLETILETDADGRSVLHHHQRRWMDLFQMTPIHILVASSEPNPKLLQGILDHYIKHHQVSETDSME